MRVVLNLCGHGGVVVVPLVPREAPASIFITESTKELNEHIIDGHFACYDFWVLRAGESLLQLLGVDHVFAEDVKLVEGSVDGLLTSGVGRASDSGQEFVEVHVAIFASV